MYFLLLLLPLLGGLVGCAGTQTFTTAARAGETVALAVGYQKTLKRSNLTVSTKDANGNVTPYGLNAPQIKGVVNLYPDPVSIAVVGNRTGQTINGNAGASTMGQTISVQTGQDPEWCQTTVLMDLPATAAPGVADIIISNNGTPLRTIHVEVLSSNTTSSSNLFNVYQSSTGTATIDVLTGFTEAVHSMERADNSRVTFNNTTVNPVTGQPLVPYSIQIGFTYNSGTGKPWVINPNGDLKSINWSDNGAGNLQVIITPANGVTLDRVQKLKFYIAGGITGLAQAPSSLKAYDINGNLMAGVTAAVAAQ
jgi:hypothetical protein